MSIYPRPCALLPMPKRTRWWTFRTATLWEYLLWIFQTSRPDITHSVGRLCRFNHNPGKAHWIAAKHVLRYLAGTPHHGITYSRNDHTPHFIQYSDADWANCPDTRRSTTGYVTLMANGAIAWKSKLQKTTASSTVVAEYQSLYDSARQVAWLRSLHAQLGFDNPGPTTVFEDNEGCIALSANRRTDSLTKHIDVKFYYTRELWKPAQWPYNIARQGRWWPIT